MSRDRQATLPVVLSISGGFLLGVLWMDLMFDVQVLPQLFGGASIPEAALDSISAYYRRVTTDARPMGHLVGTGIALSVLGSLAQGVGAAGGLWYRFAPLLFSGIPGSLAALRTVPNAIRLGGRADTLEVQAELARSILLDHLICVTSIAIFIALQLRRATRSGA